MLDREGGEVARATTIVRYAPGSHFSEHTPGGGEELFVVEGRFSDEHGDHPAGNYARNPPGSSHAPSNEKGCGFSRVQTYLGSWHEWSARDLPIDSRALAA